MIALSGTFFGGALVQATAGVYYAMGNTKTPSKISAIIYTFYIPLKIAAFFAFGLIGLAVSMSSYFLINCLVQFLMLRKDVRRKRANSYSSGPVSDLRNLTSLENTTSNP